MMNGCVKWIPVCTGMTGVHSFISLKKGDPQKTTIRKWIPTFVGMTMCGLSLYGVSFP